jgi:hypothetical protein
LAAVTVTEEQDMPSSAAAAQGFPACQAGIQQPGTHRGTTRASEAGSAEAGLGSPGASCQARLAGLLRDAATASERNWRGTRSQEERDLSVLALAAALGDLSVFCTRLSACSRLHAMNEPTPQAFTRAALVHAATRFVHQAWLVLPDAAAGAGDDWQATPADPVQQAARHAADWWQPAAAVDEQALELLAEAMSALASGAGALAASTAGPVAADLAGVQACTEAAARQLRAA